MLVPGRKADMTDQRMEACNDLLKELCGALVTPCAVNSCPQGLGILCSLAFHHASPVLPCKTNLKRYPNGIGQHIDFIYINGAPDRIRTCDLCLRRATL